MWNYLSKRIYKATLRSYHGGAWFLGKVLSNKKALQWVEGRQGTFELIKDQINPNKSTIWFHCASLGEFEQGRPLIEHIRNAYPKYQILLTFFSPSGYEVRKNYPAADIICYLPSDSKKNAKQFIDLVNPNLVLFVKYDFWYYYLSKLKKNNIPTLLFSSTFRKNQPFFQWYGSLWRKMLHCFDQIYVQDKVSYDLLHMIDVPHCAIANDTRFDRVHAIANAKKSFPPVNSFAGDSPVLVAGSTWPKDDDLLIPYIAAFAKSPRKYIIAPHNLSEEGLSMLEKKLGDRCIRYSDIAALNAADRSVLIIDNIGMLSSLYGYADIAYVGGGFDTSIHNILEAAVFGVPIIFGPNHEKSIEALELLYAGGAFAVHNLSDLKLVMERLSVKENRTIAGDICKKYVADRLGGTETIIGYLKAKNLINNS